MPHERTPQPDRRTFAVALAAVWLACTGCARTHSAAPADQPAQAGPLALSAGALMDSDPARARALLESALRIDVDCGEAHNNLGSMALLPDPPTSTPDARPDLFTAADHLQSAARLLPGRPDPLMNLGLIYERAGRLSDAQGAYMRALERDPQHVPSAQALTSLEVRTSATNDTTRARLEMIALRGTTAHWRAWAADRLRRQAQ
jgi:Tfp pilus assembly protein PilF